MAGNSPFPGWEILCLGNTELNDSPPGQSWSEIVEGGYSQGEEGETSLRKASKCAVVISATVEHSFNALHLQSGLQTLINPPRVPVRQVLVSPFYRWIKC